jgi:phage shock protein C
MGRRLTKSEDQKMLFGVCGGLAEYFGLDATLVRLAFVFLTIIGVGSPIIIYIILAFVMPNRYSI